MMNEIDMNEYSADFSRFVILILNYLTRIPVPIVA
jgi:hypothetical protein